MVVDFRLRQGEQVLGRREGRRAVPMWCIPTRHPGQTAQNPALAGTRRGIISCALFIFLARALVWMRSSVFGIGRLTCHDDDGDHPAILVRLSHCRF